LGISNAFAGGLFLAAGFVHLLAESNEILVHSEMIDANYPWGLLFCSLGFLFAFFFEKVFFSKYHTHSDIENESPQTPHQTEKSPLIKKTDDEEHHHSKHEETHSDHDHHLGNSLAPYILMIVLSVHSFISGVAVGVQTDEENAWPLAIAIIAHKWVEAFAVGVSLKQMNIKKMSKYFGLIVLYSTMEPLGLVLGTIISAVIANSNTTQLVEAIVSAVASGTFIYVAVIDILVEEFSHQKDKYTKTFFCMLGFGCLRYG